MKSIHACVFVLAALITLWTGSAAFAQEGTTDPTTTTGATTTEPATESAPAPDPWAETPRTHRLKERALWFRLIARKLSSLMRQDRPYLQRTRSDFASLLRYRLWLRDAWRLRVRRARFRAHHPPHLEQWTCIHRREGPWKDPNPPYYGGLQMDLAFQRAYGRSLLRHKGTANHWAPYEQMWIAERALRAGRGFYPWPLTARSCGLI